MTEKTYEELSFLRELTTTVTDCFSEDGKNFIMLKETIFFPEEGGQYADTGTIECGGKTVRVLNGELIGNASEGETDIRYEVDSPIEKDSQVHLKLDWNKRLDRMENHSGEHILSGLIHNLFGYNNIGFHLSDDEPVTLVCDGKLTSEQITLLEKKANEAVRDNLSITDSYPDKEELKNLSYRSKIDIAGQVRLITIGDEAEPLDVCACCAPHVEFTGMVGVIKILSSAPAKGGTQLSFLCGRRAFEYIDRSLGLLKGLADSFSTNQENVPGLIDKLRDDNRVLREKLSDSFQRSILESVKCGDHVGPVVTDLELSPADMKNIFNELIAEVDGYTGVFAGNDETGYVYYAGGKGLDAKKLGELMKEHLSAKGGGSSEMIQGRTAETKARILEFWKTRCQNL
ncbi:MAG: alanyl-tRNA editing protein [Lachnospiraceae bacterium]|nr:alanyl-tRNA editing protein [Lachnospiraceae bacterium]